MRRLLAIPALALLLTACAPSDNPDQQQQRQQALFMFVQAEIDLAIDIYGDDWLANMDREQRFAILSTCNALMILSTTAGDLPPDTPARVAETCRALRGASAEINSPMPEPKPE